MVFGEFECTNYLSKNELFSGLSESILRTVLILLAQVSIGAVIGILLGYFSKHYKRAYMRWWSVSAITFCLSILVISGLTARVFTSSEVRTWASVVAMLFQNIHLLTLLAGSYLAGTDKDISKKWIWAFAILVLLIASLPLLFANTPNAENWRYILRMGVREALTTLAFIAAGLMVWAAGKNKTLGARFVAVSLSLYGLAHSYYLFVIAQNLSGNRVELPSFFGVAETVLISWIGFGLIIWMLEEERVHLQQINKKLDSFLYSTSHDLRAPIASVLGITNLSKLEIKDPTSLQYIGMIEDRVKKLDLVISDILQLSKTTHATLKNEAIELDKLMADVLSDVQFNTGAEAIALQFEKQPGATFIGDYSQMKIILGNLVNNAVRYHRLDQPNPFVAIRFEKHNGQVILEVEDNGEGIAASHQQKIFDMFYRASSRADGTGLGLYIVKEALARVGGTVTVQSQLGVGTTFRVILPQKT